VIVGSEIPSIAQKSSAHKPVGVSTLPALARGPPATLLTDMDWCVALRRRCGRCSDGKKENVFLSKRIEVEGNVYLVFLMGSISFDGSRILNAMRDRE
jgi:hypothetical protein